MTAAQEQPREGNARTTKDRSASGRLTMDPVESAYIHVPFCKSKCLYCDFNSYAGREGDVGDYFSALVREIQLVDSAYNQESWRQRKPLRNIFFGGGTPSFVPSSHIIAVLEALRSTFGIEAGAEITVECNPGTVDLEKFRDYRRAGVSRISIGLQSASDAILQKIGRTHALKDFEQCMDDADLAGLTNRNVDLMFGLPSQTMEDVMSSLRLVLERNITHVSFYSLILEEGTPFYREYSARPELLPSEELERDMYWSGVKELKKRGFLHYEISNLAKPGFLCNQNIIYWKSKEYLGFGAGAHSYQQHIRIGNEQGIRPYIDRINHFHGCSNAPAAVEQCELSAKDREMEFFMLGFRLLDGVDTFQFEKTFPGRLEAYLPGLSKLIDKGYLSYRDGIYTLTKYGVDFANQVFMEFV